MYPAPTRGQVQSGPSEADPGESGQERRNQPTSRSVKRGLRTTETIQAKGDYPLRTKMFVASLMFRANI